MKLPTLIQKLALLSLAGIFLGGCAASAPDVYSNVDPNSDFRAIKSYGFIAEASTDKAGYESLETNFLKVAVAQQLDRRGLNYDPANPDVLMNFYIHTKEKVKSRQTPTMGGGYYGYRGGYYDDFGYGYGIVDYDAP